MFEGTINLSDELLMESYLRAIELGLADEFIMILAVEIDRRRITKMFDIYVQEEFQCKLTS
ncbi:sporulation histidine kinase inhibitor Sda [Halalkalibacter krulwichiae]|uniref:Sporulation inhibitor A n=1 Tax=Halalkalibacter krulwichiae TaxID=199441 RepID=A0A1X9M9J8_9BACI|nr:sporulation histidine kinase inhibitor Sda [Halalkalibacter krulwichiae]ARK30085.1 Sporulation inhibitor A [Halalkalibacter krulwichiae]